MPKQTPFHPFLRHDGDDDWRIEYSPNYRASYFHLSTPGHEGYKDEEIRCPYGFLYGRKIHFKHYSHFAGYQGWLEAMTADELCKYVKELNCSDVAHPKAPLAVIID